MILIDTNIFLYAVNGDDPRSSTARRALESIINSGGPWALSWSIVYEFLRVATHPRVFPAPLDAERAWAFIAEIIHHPGGLMLTETVVHEETVDRCIQEAPRMHGNLLHDFHIAVLMREHGIKRVLTENRDFLMFPWIEVQRLPDKQGKPLNN
ncbi:MAG TPA: PIN domain-containing protein [Kiritimatiellia bacterium]|nr:PIN domain-containing protein [Kiritimatiellia bacterium]HMO99465.1 PIN domain-containing protein [Kiritimatiellia bacterium]HMP97371.1 PIN domain-containing protein [Kiritimatiellia bacterium]